MFEISYSCYSPKGITKKDINNILDTANKINKEHNITGCLVHYKNKFIQLLEGENQLSLISLNISRKTLVTITSEYLQKKRTYMILKFY